MASVWAALMALRAWAQAIAAFFGFARQAADTIQTHEDIEAGRAAGQAEVEAAQAREGEAAQAEIAAEAAKDVSEDDAIARMKRGEG